MSEPDAHTRRLARSALIGRLLATHFLCYPLMFIGAAAGMSLSIVLQKQSLLAAGATRESESGFQRWLVGEVGLSIADAAVFERIIVPTSIVLAVIFVLAHVASVPWALAARRKVLGRADDAEVRRARNVWIIASLGGTGLVVLAGLVGWSIILFSS